MSGEIPKPLVYVAGPIYGSGTPNGNLRDAIKAAEMLRRAGAIPFVPHLFLQWEVISPHPSQEYWLEMDFAWLSKCHALVRLDGESPGADREVEFCRQNNIPVYSSGELTGAAVIDVFTGVRRFIGDLTSGRFDRHRIVHELETMDSQKSEDRARALGEDELYAGITQLQDLVGAWIDRQPFRDQKPHQPLLGISEEVGELCHAHLKNEQGIRGFEDAEYTKRKKMDALGDIFVYMCGYAKANNISLAESIRMAWVVVRARDWNSNSMSYPQYSEDQLEAMMKRGSTQGPYSDKSKKGSPPPVYPNKYIVEDHSD